MRYQYLSLVHFLHKGHYPAHGIPMTKVTEPFEPNVCQEGDYLNAEWLQRQGYFIQEDSGWPAFMMHTSQQFGLNEKCDCHRADFVNETVENRFYKDPSNNVAVTFFSLSYLPIHGRYPHGTLPPSNVTRELYSAMAFDLMPP